MVVIPRSAREVCCERLVEGKEAEAKLTRQVRMGLQAMDAITEILESERTLYLD